MGVGVIPVLRYHGCIRLRLLVVLLAVDENVGSSSIRLLHQLNSVFLRMSGAILRRSWIQRGCQICKIDLSKC